MSKWNLINKEYKNSVYWLQPDRPIIEKGPMDRGSFRPRVW